MSRLTQERLDACPLREDHVQGEPDGYLAWHEWAAEKSKTHIQRKCQGCGLFVIWVPKKPGEDTYSTFCKGTTASGHPCCNLVRFAGQEGGYCRWHDPRLKRHG